LCIVHLVRAALKYVTTSDSPAVVADLKKIYQSATVLEAEQALDSFAEVWGENSTCAFVSACVCAGIVRSNARANVRLIRYAAPGGRTG
jgi:hypothetical protein